MGFEPPFSESLLGSFRVLCEGKSGKVLSIWYRASGTKGGVEDVIEIEISVEAGFPKPLILCGFAWGTHLDSHDVIAHGASRRVTCKNVLERRRFPVDSIARSDVVACVCWVSRSGTRWSLSDPTQMRLWYWMKL